MEARTNNCACSNYKNTVLRVSCVVCDIPLALVSSRERCKNKWQGNAATHSGHQNKKYFTLSKVVYLLLLSEIVVKLVCSKLQNDIKI